MSDIIITYENLYEILRREKYRTELQEVNPTFYKDVVKYLAEKKAILESQAKKDSIFASTELEKTQTQLKNVQKILKELYEKRENKTLQFALFASRTDNIQDTSKMLPAELQLYQDLKQILDKYREGILGSLMRGNLPDIKATHSIQQKPLNKEEKTITRKVQIIEDIPEFVGPDLNTYGPYRKDDTQDLPDTIAKLLIQTNQATA
tara:strand:- start:1639 stop:2256 length:618 start_codon:yes stop_codon:yes gene_type:complete